MKTIYKKMRTAKSLLFLLFTLLTSLNVQAADIETVALELGKEYSGTMMDNIYLSYTPAESGKLVFTGTGEMPTPYVDAAFETVYEDHTVSFVSGGKEMEMNVAKDVTYYLCIRNHVTDWTFTAKMADASVITMEYANPAPNQEFPLSLGGFLEIHFDTSVTVGQALLQTGTTVVEVSAMAYGKDVSMELKPVLFSWMKEGVLKAGDTFTLTINDVKSAYDESVLYNGDGKLVLTWTASAKPAEVVKSTLPEKFLSFWPYDAEAGVVTVEYDAELSTEKMPYATIGFGSPEVEGDYYVEEIPVQIEGKTMTLDFRGTRRVPAEMVASGFNYGQMRLKVNNIYSADGNYVYAEGQGTFGSFQHMFAYEEISFDLTTEFTPASGSSLAGVSAIELWLSNSEAVSFDGVYVEFKSAAGEFQNVQYTNEECNYKNEGADGITLTIPVTAEMQEGENVTVMLTNLVSNDGLYREIMAVYNPKEEFKPFEILPANESTITALESATLVYNTDVTVAQGAQASVMAGRMEVAKANIMVSRFDTKSVLVFLDTPITDPGYYRILIPEGVISNAAGETNETISLMYEVKAETSGVFTFSPEDGSTVESLKEIIVSYEGGCHPAWWGQATLVDEAGNTVATAEPSDYVPADKQEEYDNWSWAPESTLLTLDKEITTPGTYTLQMPEGFFVCGANYDNSPELTATFTIEGAAVPALAYTMVTPETGSTVPVLEMIELVFGESVSINAEVANPVTVTDRMGMTTFAEGSTLSVLMASRGRAVAVNLSTPLTEAGVYMVKIAAGAIVGQSGATNEDIYLMYEVAAQGGGGFAFTPEDGSTVESLKEIIVSYEGGCHPAWWGQAILVDEAGNTVATAEPSDYVPADKQEDYANWLWEAESTLLTLDKEITTPGTYTLQIPAGYFVCGANYDNSPEVTATFIITDGNSIGNLFAKDQTVTVYTTGGVRLMQNATKAQLQQLRPGTYIINGKKVYLRK